MLYTGLRPSRRSIVLVSGIRFHLVCKLRVVQGLDTLVRGDDGRLEHLWV